MHEAQMNEANSFITLTYRNEDLPKDGSLEVKDWQKFAKRLRKKGMPFRYLMCGEYGENTFRCHWHAAIFGLDFRNDLNAKVVSENELGQPLYRSPLLEEVWGLGHTWVGELTFESARYVAQYLTKKDSADWESIALGARTDAEGKSLPYRPPFATSSRNHGIGHSWICKYFKDVYPHDEVILNGVRCKPPKYYDQIAEKIDPAFMADLKEKRKERALLSADNSPGRLAQRKEYQELKLKSSRKNT